MNEVGSAEGEGSSDPALLAYHQNTINHIKRQQQKEGDLGARFTQLNI